MSSFQQNQQQQQQKSIKAQQNDTHLLQQNKEAQLQQELSQNNINQPQNTYNNQYQNLKLENKENILVFLEVKIGDLGPQRMIFELFKKNLPYTCENFRALCTGERGIGKSGLQLHYKNSFFTKIQPGFWALGGDFDKEGGESIYGNKFKDENFLYSHRERGYLSMANFGPNTNGSQFFITFKECAWLDGKNVVFGKIKEGEKVLDMIEKAGQEEGKLIYKTVQIVDCGELKM
ncbi:Cyclophilin-like peptidyl-prolyl cis-trans isomerase domain [Pseudocohnilembus persalinus]|uniref:Peptidyl-prolyl cis-trans isomerase n=1 Tax=Pseudocohnilembus persalinus TaxID=266149 RepID=A0A0V0R3E2_PSEPJ|nr:Cyclophilin-like peptidyl-prolyl cis-trans isomerase domain [Pseudocohnilembus persalinus]|eukprot:KRX08848.1 Cyclophilin-like peptidyl-prolyl cis-trans isomerase domain [Pseudocohnilembus persalinus]